MIVLGITGGVGSGKSAVLQYISDNYNVKLIITDDLAKSMLCEDLSLKNIIKSVFKDDNIIYENGELDREKLAGLVFNNKEKLDRLNSLVHPAVKEAILKEIKSEEERGVFDGLIIEAALLLEGGYDKLFDVLFVYAKEDIRRERLKKSRNYSDEKITSIMNNQLSKEVFLARCKYVIDNNFDFNKTARTVDDILINKYSLRRYDGK